MADLGYQAFNPNFGKELDIEAMISAPLVAASKANVIMVTGQTRFLLEYCFTKDDDGVYAPVMIIMSMTKGTVDETKEVGQPGHITMTKLTFSMPLLCIIPINSLAIDKVSIDFDMEITSAIPKQATTANGSNTKVTETNATLNGKIGNSSPDQRRVKRSSNPDNNQISNHLKVSLNATPLPLPTGVLTIIDLYTKGIQPISVPASTTQETKNSGISSKS